MSKYLFYQISYSVTDPSLEDTSKYPYFYTTIPDDHFLNKVRQELLKQFNWKRVGIFSVDDEYHVSVSINNNIDILNISTVWSVKLNLQGFIRLGTLCICKTIIQNIYDLLIQKSSIILVVSMPKY